MLLEHPQLALQTSTKTKPNKKGRKMLSKTKHSQKEEKQQLTEINKKPCRFLQMMRTSKGEQGGNRRTDNEGRTGSQQNRKNPQTDRQ